MSDHTSSQGTSGPGTPRPATAPGAGFFAWIRRIGISRGDAWIGGVCGGIAARLGIDPIIVRGIAVVVALLGGPAFLLYGLAWLLLPDTAGTIHLERLTSGIFDAATAGVIVFVLLAFLPLAQGVWWAAAWPFGAAVSWPATLGKVVWSVVVVAAIVAVVVWASRRAGGWGAGAGRGWGASAWAPTPGEQSAPDPARPETGTAPFSATAAPTAPVPPGQGASPSAVDDWRARQADWKARYDVWKAQQADATRAAREQRWADAASRQVADLERARLHRLSNPRTSGPFVAITLGVALIVGAVASALAWGLPELRDFQAAFGVAAATAVIGLSMVVAGLMRRRSGFLAFVAIVLTVVTVALLAGVTNPVTFTVGTTTFHV